MTTQPEALRLADACDILTNMLMIVPGLDTVECAAELRRLHAVNQELLEALKEAKEDLEHWGAYAGEYSIKKWGLAIARISATITKHGGAA